jgi:hypothetical protein
MLWYLLQQASTTDSAECATAPSVARLTRSSIGVDNGGRSRACNRVRVATEHGHTRTKFGTSKGNHVLADVNSNLLALVGMSVHQDPLDQIVAILIASDVDERDAGTIRASSRDDSEVAIHEVETANLETFLNHLRGELVDAVIIGVGEDVIHDTTLVRGRAVFTQVLNTPIAELTVSDEVDVDNDFFNSGTLRLSVCFLLRLG